ncbi:50S ribosomal subunit protein L2 [Candidatus Hodgkinia cicadicola]|uniref:50S ribosomal protein L2 n=1 Tax=Candidatus Hodgkinia cicadicola TaxID=573658 RepID=A0ABX4MIV7_9HYPH|nr:50S ribosomal subunit protein L2 [Candidatus Hodgkinia cicadicola]PIM95272.1 50S ribosomal subunit protein L2 [Candidatus Hodgkinia cicadicola]
MTTDYKLINPTSPGRRGLIQFKCSEIYKNRSVKTLTKKICESSGRNNTGKITVRHRGGRCKRAFRIIDYKRNTNDRLLVLRIEHDPNRSANIALVKTETGSLKYIIAVDGLKTNDWIKNNINVSNGCKLGSTSNLGDLPLGIKISNVELYPKSGGNLSRSAGCYCQILAKFQDKILIKLSSGIKKLLNRNCIATIGIISNKNHFSKTIGKAGRSRWLGKRPSVRGVAMNPIDHPMGGGEGKTSGGRHPVSPWGKLSKGGKTKHKHYK